MAANAEQKTEPPTPRRRSQARKRGQVARSQDLSAAVLLCVAFLSLYVFGAAIWHSMLAIVAAGLEPGASTDVGSLLPFSRAVAEEALRRLTPFLLSLFVALVAVLLAQTGFLFTLHPITPSLNKINPLSGIKRLVSPRMLMTAATNSGKLVIVGLVAGLTLFGAAAKIVYGCTLGLHDAFRLGLALMFELGMKLSAALFVLALLDYAWQRYKHEKDLRMTKEEVKDELRSMDGDPKLKQRRRQVQLQLAMQRIRKDVPTADVVVTNPTHLAIAIRYDSDSMAAPKVVAKGADQLALRIRQLAKEFSVPIVERRALARALYEAVEVGGYIPEQFYRAIAEILAYVYELTGRSPARARRDLVGAT